jgi:DNA polymerase III alpha subunit
MNLREICKEKLNQKGLSDPIYLKRLNWELLETEIQNKENYFIDLYNRGVKYPENQNNLLVPYLLDIVKDFDIDRDPEFFYGDLPDCDVDYIPVVREYLKNEWSIKQFGQDYVCNIGNYTTYGIKSSLIDMARVHDKDRGELLALTTKLQTKDDEGKALTWESAMKVDPGLKKYCDDNPDIAKAAHKLIDRNRGMGVHAGGLIISSIPLTDLVPLVKRKDDPQASAWVEGLHGQDLQPVGLVKFDLLVISNLLQIAHCCRLVHERHGIEKICALPGKSNWTDVDQYRNDEKALLMANEGDLKCIFQFDSDGIRNLARSGGVTRFEDLVAYSALYRPGCLTQKMHERYVERKRGREEYELHPILDSILEKTYGVIIYQEQVMKILNVVGNIPMRDVETVRKAISKKKVEQFIKYKEIFIKNGSKNLDQTEEELESFWGTIESWAEYGFNASHATAYTHVSSRLLYLKSHYPHEFYTAILMCEDNTDKIKEYRKEIIKHNVKINKIDINKSKANFSLVDDEIYFGFSNVKGIGINVAEQIVEKQPYANFEDFIDRFGTDSSVLKPLISTGSFKDSDPVTLFKFAEAYKDYTKKKIDRKKRHQASSKKNKEVLMDLIDRAENSSETIKKLAKGEIDPIDSKDLKKVSNCEIWKERYKGLKIDGKDLWKEVCKLINKMTKATEKFKLKDNQDKPDLESFDPLSITIDKKLEKELLESLAECEKRYYGFSWTSKIRNSLDYQGGCTFDSFTEGVNEILPVEIEITAVNKRKGKRAEYYQIKAEDENGDEGVINVWKDDYNSFQNEIVVGNFVRLRLNAPSNGFKTYTLSSIGPRNFYKKKQVEKSDDYRLVLLRKPNNITDDTTVEQEKEIEKCQTNL